MSLSTLLVVGASALVAASASVRGSGAPYKIYVHSSPEGEGEGVFVMFGAGWLADPNLANTALSYVADCKTEKEKDRKIGGLVYDGAKENDTEEVKIMAKKISDAMTCAMDSMDFFFVSSKYVPGMYD